MSLRMRAQLPSLAGAATWVNGVPAEAELAGRPLLVQFWSISCPLCHEASETVTGWREKYEPLGMRFLAVHQPRGPEELDIDKVSIDAAGPMALEQPCAIDNDHAIVERFANQFVPAYYVFDSKHELRHFQAGEKGYEQIESAIDRVLAESGESAPA